MKLFIVFASLVLAISASTDEELWTKFKQDHEKTYKSLREDELRFSVFKSNLRRIEEHNAKYEKGEETWTKGINQFSDLTVEEFKEKYLNYKPLNIEYTGTFALDNLTAVPDSIDWREKAVLSVKDQKACGSCWAFSTVGAIEGQNALKNNVKEDLSPQELIDCASAAPYNMAGCKGGLMDPGFEYVKDHGISKLSDYPYVARDDRCKNPKNSAGIKLTGFVDVPHNEAALKQAVGTVGPVAIAINGDLIKEYHSGIFDNFFCLPALDHAVLAVGYGSEKNHDYWIVKNSWGAKWGDNGYIKMTRNRFNQCGIASQPSYPVLA